MLRITEKNDAYIIGKGYVAIPFPEKKAKVFVRMSDYSMIASKDGAYYKYSKTRIMSRTKIESLSEI